MRPSAEVARCSAQLVRYANTTVPEGIRSAVHAIAADIGVLDLRRADPAKYVGIVLFDGFSGREEEANGVLANIAPMLAFVGASAGDGFTFSSTSVFANGVETDNGVALLLLEAAAPFTIGRIDEAQKVLGAPVAGGLAFNQTLTALWFA